MVEKIDRCKNNPQNSSTTKVCKNIPSSFSMSTISLFKSIENKCDVYRGKKCMKKFWQSLREHLMEKINFKKKQMKLLAKKELKSYENAKICYICKQKFQNKHAKDKKFYKVSSVEVLYLAYII